MTKKIARKIKTKFIYFAPLDFDNVFKTQVVGWVNLYRENGLDFEIAKLNSVKRIFDQKKRKSELDSIRKIYSGKIHYIYTFPEKILIGKLINSLIFFFTFLRAGGLTKKICFQIRSSSFSGVFKILQVILGNRFILIYDSRAAAAEEYIYIKKNPTIKELIKYKRLIEQDIRMVEISNYIFCVSNVLINYLKKLAIRHSNVLPRTSINAEKDNQTEGVVEDNRFVLYPCSADERHFFFDEVLRIHVRKHLGIENRLVFVYSGGLEMPWHIPNKVFQLFSQIERVNQEAYFITLTNDTKIAYNYFKKHGFSKDKYMVEKVNNTSVHKYLNAADFGVLLRENHLMNNVASPTKFAEYIMCGLPVIISEGVGDFSKIVKENGFGFIYNPEYQNLPTNFERYLNVSLKKKIASFGQSNYSKQARLQQLINIYKSI
jgi:glycosyltransferase involved in cell wall biosynthesis